MVRDDADETSPDEVVGRESPLYPAASRADADNRNSPTPDCGLESLQSSMTERRRDWGRDSDP